MSLSPGASSFPRCYRLLLASDYKRVFLKPTKVSSSDFLILYSKNNLSESRLGMAIAKKQLPLAVDRNRIKRLIRESFRRKKQQLYSIDIVVITRKTLFNMDNNQIRIQLNKLWEKITHKERTQ